MNAICTGCNYCEGCPENIAIASYMQFYNEKQMFGADDLTMRRQLGNQYEWGLLGSRRGAAAQCVECAQCEEKCTQHIPIVRRLKEIASWETGHGKT
jgi:predicted aldo/keto reductase-like oxidoreductase